MSTKQNHAVLMGASKGIGYHVLLRLLAKDEKWKATILLRKPNVISNDPRFGDALSTGRLNIIKGDATVEEDVRKLFENRVDVIITSVGGAPVFSWSGIHVDQPTICGDATTALLHVLQDLHEQKKYLPRVIAVSSMGMGDNHKVMPLALRITYPLFLSRPHADKETLEYLLQRSSSKLSTPKSHIPSPQNLKPDIIETIKENFLPEIIIIRPALLVGNGSAEEVSKIRGKEKTKIGEEVYCYTVNRAEVGRFIFEECLPRHSSEIVTGEGKDKWVNRLLVVGW